MSTVTYLIINSNLNSINQNKTGVMHANCTKWRRDEKDAACQESTDRSTGQQSVDERRRAERYKKRYQWILKKLKPKTWSSAAETPRTKTRRLLRYVNVSDHVRRTLMFHNAIIDNLSSCFKKCKKQIAKRTIRSSIMGRIIRQCKMQMFCRDVFGFSSRAKVERAATESTRRSVLNLPSESTAFRERLHHTVKQFYLRVVIHTWESSWVLKS